MRGRGAWLGLGAALLLYAAMVARFWRLLGPYVVDDAFIFLRYADHLAHGLGLVYNPGQAVEGYTSLLWTVLLAGAIRVGLPPLLFAQAAGVVLGGGTIVCTFLLARRLFPGAVLAASLPPLLLATNRTFCIWSVEGMDAKLFGACLAAVAMTAVSPRRLPLLGLLLGLLVLARPEGYLVAAAAAGTLGLSALRTRAPGKVAAEGVLFLAIAAGHLLFRWRTYGDLVPNTFHAKVAGLSLNSGLSYVASMARGNWILFYAPVALWGAWLLLRDAEDRAPKRLFLVTLVLFIAYWIAIGGDYFEFRFLDAVLPLWALCPARAVAAAAARARPIRPAAALGGLCLAANACTLTRPPADTPTTPEREAQYTQHFVLAARWLARNLAPGESIAIRPAGVIPYLSGAPTLDLLGLNDREIARSPRFRQAGGLIAHRFDVPVTYARERGVTYFLGHPRLEAAPAPPPLASVEVVPGTYLLFLPLSPAARWQPGVHRVWEHAGLLPGWTPAHEGPHAAP